jgi:hypothetical protein
MIIIMLIEVRLGPVVGYEVHRPVKILNSKTLFANVEAENLHKSIAKYVVINVGRFV